MRVSGQVLVFLLATSIASISVTAAERPGEARAPIVESTAPLPPRRGAADKPAARRVEPAATQVAPPSARAPHLAHRKIDPDVETPADAGRADRPGSFGRQPVKLPGTFLHKNVVAPHTEPDLQIGGDGKTTLGVFGSANRIEPTDARNSTTKPITDVGAGLTLKYRFGQ